jgi:ubiquinone/menaquinone biosynthesis C-methylase UbiE
MKVKITFDFHDVFVNSKEAWILAFTQVSGSNKAKEDYISGMTKKDISRKYNLDYSVVEEKYRELLKPIHRNIEFIRKLSKYYEIDVVSLSRKERLLKDIEKFKLLKYFTNIYSKLEVRDKKEFLEGISSEYDWVVYFNHEEENLKIYGNIVYIPIDFYGDVEEFGNISFTEHAKGKLLYNELSGYYMKAIANDTELETAFIKQIFNKYFNKDSGVILDCCCGVGRHSFALGREGFDVVGIDYSMSQIDTARSIHLHDNVEYFVQDARDIELSDKRFDMSICMWTTYNYFSQDGDLLKFIHSNYHHQKKDGILILDSKNIPRLEKRRVYRRNYKSLQDNIEMELIINKFIIGNIQNSQYFYFIEDKGEKSFYLDDEFVRFYTLDEIKNIVEDYYTVEEIYGDFDMSSYDEAKSNRFILVLKRK